MSDHVNNIQKTNVVISPEFIRKQSAHIPSSATFKDILTEQKTQLLNDIKFSGHALDRLQQRNIHLSEGEHSRLRSAFEQVTEKGGTDSLVIMDSLAFVINAKNRTVVTAMTQENLRDKVFTKIDSAVII